MDIKVKDLFSHHQVYRASEVSTLSLQTNRWVMSATLHRLPSLSQDNFYWYTYQTGSTWQPRPYFFFKNLSCYCIECTTSSWYLDGQLCQPNSLLELPMDMQDLRIPQMSQDHSTMCRCSVHGSYCELRKCSCTSIPQKLCAMHVSVLGAKCG